MLVAWLSRPQPTCLLTRRPLWPHPVQYRTGGAEGTPERGSTLAEAVGALAGRPQAAAALLASGTLPVWQRAVEQSVAERVPGVDRDWSANTVSGRGAARCIVLVCSRPVSISWLAAGLP